MYELFKPFENITMLQIAAFLIPFILAIMIDLRQHKAGEAITMANAAKWSVVWFLCAMAFAGFVYWNQGLENMSLFLSGYLLEKALAIDNLFAFS